MNTYAAFLRGIGPENPNMRNERLRAVFENLGFKNVKSVISSGNIVFESAVKDATVLEKKIERALQSTLGIGGGAFVRSEAELERIIKKDPFEGASHGGETYLIVSFLKQKPYEVYTALTREEMRTPKAMAAIEKRYSKQVTTRTWKTVGRVLKKMHE